jgi:flagellar biosynthesis protein FlhB
VSAEEDDGKTEAPTPARLKNAYQEGNVPLGRDVVMAAGFVAGAVALLNVAGDLSDSLVKLVWTSLSRVGEGHPKDLLLLMGRPLALTGLVCAAVALGAAVAAAVQTKFGFWWNLAGPKMDRLFSGGRLKQMFNKEALQNLGLTAVKFVALGATLWVALRDEFVTLPRMLQLGPNELLAAMFGPLARALVKVVTVLVIIAGVDLAVTRRRFTGRLKMTKEEVKREFKDEEGDPMIKGRRRARHREVIRGRINVEVPRADVLVVNPTHIAIALRYRADEDKAPRVTAKGKGEKAEKMRELAREHGIPIVENIPLARLLYRKVKVGRSVPAETFKAVAAILAFVYRALGRDGDRPAARPAERRRDRNPEASL